MLQQKCIDSIKGSSPETPSLTKQGKASREEVIVDLGFGKWVGLACFGILWNMLVTGGSLRYVSSLFWAPGGGRGSWNTGGRMAEGNLALYQPRRQESWSDLPEVTRKLAHRPHFYSTPIVHMAHSSRHSLIVWSFSPKPKTQFLSQSIPLPYPASLHFLALISTWHCISIGVFLSVFPTRL